MNTPKRNTVYKKVISPKQSSLQNKERLKSYYAGVRVIDRKSYPL